MFNIFVGMLLGILTVIFWTEVTVFLNGIGVCS